MVLRRSLKCRGGFSLLLVVGAAHAPVVFEVLDGAENGLVPVWGVALVAGINLLAAALGELDVGVSVDELAQGRVQGEAGRGSV